jgi:hypothetical protein
MNANLIAINSLSAGFSVYCTGNSFSQNLLCRDKTLMSPQPMVRQTWFGDGSYVTAWVDNCRWSFSRLNCLRLAGLKIPAKGSADFCHRL